MPLLAFRPRGLEPRTSVVTRRTPYTIVLYFTPPCLRYLYLVGVGVERLVNYMESRLSRFPDSHPYLKRRSWSTAHWMYFSVAIRTYQNTLLNLIRDNRPRSTARLSQSEIFRTWIYMMEFKRIIALIVPAYWTFITKHFSCSIYITLSMLNRFLVSTFPASITTWTFLKYKCRFTMGFAYTHHNIKALSVADQQMSMVRNFTWRHFSPQYLNRFCYGTCTDQVGLA